jgi:hypothetical protein
MKFGAAEMAQMMDAAKALITVTMISSVHSARPSRRHTTRQLCLVATLITFGIG